MTIRLRFTAVGVLGRLAHRSRHLVVQRLATESDLGENHYFENVGDTIWANAVGISYCPFWGDLLPDAKRSMSWPDAEYQHVDCGGWDAEVQ